VKQAAESMHPLFDALTNASLPGRGLVEGRVFLQGQPVDDPLGQLLHLKELDLGLDKLLRAEVTGQKLFELRHLRRFLADLQGTRGFEHWCDGQAKAQGTDENHSQNGKNHPATAQDNLKPVAQIDGGFQDDPFFPGLSVVSGRRPGGQGAPGALV
jgi:hypothetical protein